MSNNAPDYKDNLFFHPKKNIIDADNKRIYKSIIFNVY